MTTKALALLIASVALAALAAPVHATAGEALTQAHAASNDPTDFDGARARSERGLVRQGTSTDSRTPEQIASDEQGKADARVERTSIAPAPKITLAEPASKPTSGIPNDRLIGGLLGATGGLLGGGLLAYGLSRLTA